MIQEALKYIVGLSNKVETVFESESAKNVSINGEIKRIEKPIERRYHAFYTLDGFLSYLQSARSNPIDRIGQPAPNGIIFVEQEKVVADLDYLSEVPQRAVLPLEPSEEFMALMALANGVSQKQLWRLLVTKLADHLPVDLLMQISNITIKKESAEDLEISHGGLGQRGAADKIRISCAGKKVGDSQITDLDTAWVWSGRLWEAISVEVQISLTLEVEADRELRFIFHPRQLVGMQRQSLLAIAKKLERELKGDRFTVHEGHY